MKFGFRKPSLKKSIKARTTGKIKRSLKKNVVPLYGKKGVGWVKQPKNALYHKVYNKTSFGTVDVINMLKTKEIKKQEPVNIGKELKYLQELSHLINTSNNPKVFFIKYEELVLKLREIADIETRYKFTGKLPSQNLKEVLQKRVETINDFIFRYYVATRLKVESLKQSKSKINYIEDFKNNLNENVKYMDNENIERFNKMYETLKKDCI